MMEGVKRKPVRLGIKHGEAVRIGEVMIRLSLDAKRGQGRRATLVIDNPTDQLIIREPNNPRDIGSSVCERMSCTDV